jgi:hypothetical protein
MISRRIIIAALIALGFSFSAGDVSAKDRKGFYAIMGEKSCGEYLDAYSRSTLTGAAVFSGPHIFFQATGWIGGFISAYNMTTNNGRQDVLVGMSFNARLKWIASWCRDNPSNDLPDATSALIKSRK